MPLRQKVYKSITDLMSGRIQPSFISLIDAAINLTKAFRTLHTSGLCYRDINFGNAFFDPSTGRVLVCDNDNVGTSNAAYAGVLGTPDFMAPEIVRGKSMPNTKTDLHSLAILLFYLLHVGHPLVGRRVLAIRCWDSAARTRIFGEKPQFIFDPNRRDNEAVSFKEDATGETGGQAMIYWRIYPSKIKNTFIQAFTVGLGNPDARVTELEWLNALVDLRNRILKCACGTPNFLDAVSRDAVSADPLRLRNLLRDYCTSEKCRREISVTVQCARNGLLAQLQEVDQQTPLEAYLNRLTNILHEDYGVDQLLARSIIETWVKLFGNHQRFLGILCENNLSLNQIEDADTQNKIGECYHDSVQEQQDYTEAIKWYRKAADQNYANAQYNLGACYANGTGVAKDDAEAVKWYRKAAEQHYAPAQNNLGACYANGTGVTKNEAEAVKWHRKAADQNNAFAQYNLGVCYANGIGVAKDEVEAVKWYRKAADQNHGTAQYKLAFCYENGIGVAKDNAEAAKWCRRAAQRN